MYSRMIVKHLGNLCHSNWLYLLLTISFLSNAFAESAACFPGSASSYSPPKHHEIIYKWEDDLHRLYIRKSTQRHPVKLLDFFRSACVHWSPSGEYFTLTNYVGSNLATVDIIDSEDISRHTKVLDVLPVPVKELLSKSLHGYLETVSWDRDGLIVRAFGDREFDPKEFDIKLKCRLEETKWTCSTMEKKR